MKIYLVAGNNASQLKQVLEKDRQIEVIQSTSNLSEAFHNIVENDLNFDTLLLIDQGIGENLEDFARTLADFSELFDTLFPNAKFKFVTKEPQFLDMFKMAVSEDSHFEAYFVDNVKIPVTLLQNICLNKSKSPYEDTVLLNDTSTNTKKRLWMNFKRSSSSDKSEVNNSHTSLNSFSVEQIQTPKPSPTFSANMSRVVAITGHRGSGVTSTVSNLAMEASSQGLKTVIIDLDLITRGINLYFNKFGDEVAEKPELAFSLVKCMVKPDSFKENSCIINDNLSISTLAYSVDSNDKMLEHITKKRLTTMLGILKSKFNLVLLDIPVEFFKRFPDILLHIDSIGVCITNSLYSVFSTISSINESCLGEDLLIFKMKSKLILSRYNNLNTHLGKPITKAYLPKILASISSIFDNSMECAGIIPYCDDFELQIDSGKKICSYNADYKNIYLSILSSMINY